MANNSIRDKLIAHGNVLFRGPKKMIIFTNVPQADALLNDLTGHPHAFVIACVMDRQIKAEKAWLIPFKISEKLGEFSMTKLRQLSKEDIHQLMSLPNPLHRFVDKMSDFFYSAVQRIDRDYTDDASCIWSSKPSSAEVVYRFLEFDGIGQKIATMAVNILAREFKVPFSDYYSIDISADVHVRRVFYRLGLCDKNATVEQVIFKARFLYPQFPGLMDFPCWEIGRNWCKQKSPLCSECYMGDICPSAQEHI